MSDQAVAERLARRERNDTDGWWWDVHDAQRTLYRVHVPDPVEAAIRAEGVTSLFKDIPTEAIEPLAAWLEAKARMIVAIREDEGIAEAGVVVTYAEAQMRFQRADLHLPTLARVLREAKGSQVEARKATLADLEGLRPREVLVKYQAGEVDIDTLSAWIETQTANVGDY